MSAQINLFQDHLRRPSDPLSGWRIVVLAAWSCGIMLTLAGMQAGVWYVAKRQLHDLDQQRQHLVAEQTRINEQLARYTPDPALSAQVRRLEAVLKLRGPLARLLNTDWFQGQHGYSEFFVALARQHVTGMWLTGIRITGAGNELEIQGNTVRAELLTRYLQNLSTEQVLTGIEFEQFLLQDDDPESKKPAAMSFSVTTAQ
jgi:hypothetical protein